MELDGITAGDSGYPTVINCCSAGNLFKLSGTGGSIGYTTIRTAKNCYYLDGIAGTTGITAKTGETVFYQTSDDPEAMTTAKVVTALNSYIESNEDDIDTTGWCKWVIGDNNLPALDFDTEWNGTEWVTVTN